MDLFSALLIILGLCLFETISSIDNAIINAEVLSNMGEKAKKWFLLWGLLIAVVVVRGFLPWLIVWSVSPGLGPVHALTAAFSSDPSVAEAIEHASPNLLIGGGVFLVLLFLHWLFLEEKKYGLKGEHFFYNQGVWFYAVASLMLLFLVWRVLPLGSSLALGAIAGSTAFFITHGFKENAEKQEQNLLKKGTLSDKSKIFFLIIIDATFSMDGVLGAFAFTLSVPLILLGNGLGAVVVRQLTVSNIERIKKYIYLKNGAMYSIFFLGLIMITESLGFETPVWLSPLVTMTAVVYFFMKSKKALVIKL